MTSTKLFAHLALTAATTLAATGVMTALPEAASAATVTRTINGTSYDISTEFGSFNDFRSRLTDPTTTPWWNAPSVARNFAQAVGGDLGLGNGGFGPWFTFFSFPFFGFEGISVFGVSSFADGEVIQTDIIGDSDVDYYYAFASESQPTPIPTPALLPGLLGMGLAAYRKRKLASSTSV